MHRLTNYSRIDNNSLNGKVSNGSIKNKMSKPNNNRHRNVLLSYNNNSSRNSIEELKAKIHTLQLLNRQVGQNQYAVNSKQVKSQLIGQNVHNTNSLKRGSKQQYGFSKQKTRNIKLFQLQVKPNSNSQRRNMSLQLIKMDNHTQTNYQTSMYKHLSNRKQRQTHSSIHNYTHYTHNQQQSNSISQINPKNLKNSHKRLTTDINWRKSLEYSFGGRNQDIGGKENNVYCSNRSIKENEGGTRNRKNDQEAKHARKQNRFISNPTNENNNNYQNVRNQKLKCYSEQTSKTNLLISDKCNSNNYSSRKEIHINQSQIRINPKGKQMTKQCQDNQRIKNSQNYIFYNNINNQISPTFTTMLQSQAKIIQEQHRQIQKLKQLVQLLSNNSKDQCECNKSNNIRNNISNIRNNVKQQDKQYRNSNKIRENERQLQKYELQQSEQSLLIQPICQVWHHRINKFR